MGRYVFDMSFELKNIYCDAESMPEGWNPQWNNVDYHYGVPAAVHWGWKPPLYGDLDGDGIVTVTETIEILDMVKGINALTTEQQTASDFNKDNILDIRDFNYIYYKSNNPS